jgi:hypothetical protein
VRDHLDAIRVVDRRQSSRWVTYAICLSIPTFFVVLSLLRGLSLREALVANVFWIVLALWMVLTLPFAARWAARSVIKGNPAATAPQLYRFTEAGFEERECPVEVSVAWSAITDAVETPSVLLLFTGRSSAFIVPARALAEAGQAGAVRALLRERLGDRAHLLSGNGQREA